MKTPNKFLMGKRAAEVIREFLARGEAPCGHCLGRYAQVGTEAEKKRIFPSCYEFDIAQTSNNDGPQKAQACAACAWGFIESSTSEGEDEKVTISEFLSRLKPGYASERTAAILKADFRERSGNYIPEQAKLYCLSHGEGSVVCGEGGPILFSDSDRANRFRWYAGGKIGEERALGHVQVIRVTTVALIVKAGVTDFTLDGYGYDFGGVR